MSHPNQHLNQAPFKLKRVYFSGTASTTHYTGEAVAYNRDYGTAATTEESRDRRVEPFSQSNNMWFAGTLAEDVTVDASGTAQWTTIYEPGGTGYIALGSDTVVDSTLLWATAGTGGSQRWRDDKGLGLGRGCATALVTNTSGVLGSSIDGTAVVNGTAVTDTGLFTGAAAGDFLIIMSSATAAGAAGATVGRYTISSVTDTGNAVLTTSASSAASEFMGYVISGNPTAFAYLHDGVETGGIEWIECLDNAASQSMVGGMTHIAGGVTLGTGDCTSTLADGTYIGQKKGFLLAGALTTQDYLLTVTTSPDVATLEFDADNDEALFEWGGADGWRLKELSGAAPVVMALGSGFTGTGAVTEWLITRTPTLVISQILLDITGMNSGDAANDIIGKAGQDNCHFGQLTAAKNGTIFAGTIKCYEAPTTGDPDVDFYGSVTEATGTEDTGIAALTGESKLLDHGDWSAEEEALLTAYPAANGYLYLACGDTTNATYDAGQFLLTLYGRP
jgi:hypothetical protein